MGWFEVECHLKCQLIETYAELRWNVMQVNCMTKKLIYFIIYEMEIGSYDDNLLIYLKNIISHTRQFRWCDDEYHHVTK